MNNKYLKEILINEEEILDACKKIGEILTNDYAEASDLLLIGLLKGCHPFMSDLSKEIKLPFEIDYMDVSSFFGGTKAVGEVQIVKDLTTTVDGRDIVIVEDIVDSGRTIKKVIELLNFRGAKSVEVATIFDKPTGRTVDLTPKYIGHTVPDAFIIGYGLDYKERYRNLTCIGVPVDEIID